MLSFAPADTWSFCQIETVADAIRANGPPDLYKDCPDGSLPVVYVNKIDWTKLPMLMKQFDGYDLNKDGTISTQEWVSMLVSVGVDQNTAYAKANAADADGNGTISWDEFMAVNNMSGPFSKTERQMLITMMTDGNFWTLSRATSLVDRLMPEFSRYWA